VIEGTHKTITDVWAGVTRLVVVAPTWLGDAVMALPALADVDQHVPHATVAVLARASVAPLFTLVAGVDETVVWPRGPAWRQAPSALTQGRYDAALLLPNSFHSAFVVWRAGIRERWGYAGDCRGALLTRSVVRSWSMHHTRRYQYLVGELGVPTGASEPRLDLPETVRHAARSLLVDTGWDGRSPIVALAPGAAFGGAKRWPAESFAAVAARLASEGMTAMLLGTPADNAVRDEVCAALPSGVRVLDLVGRTTLPQLAGVFTWCRALVSNDSGAMHLAAALGVPVVAVFGPTDETMTRPLGRGPCEVVTRPVWCRPCHLRECPLDHRCLRGISANLVVDRLRPWL